MKGIWVLSGGLILLMAVTLFGCDNNVANKNKGAGDNTDYYSDIGEWKAPQEIFPGKRKQHIARPSTQLINDELAVLFSTKKQIVLNYKDKDFVIDATGGSTKLWLFTDKDKKNIYTIWWKKTPEGKRLYFRGSSDLGKSFSDTVVLNTDGGVLPQIRFYGHSDGKLAVLFYDERRVPYRVYANASSDNGVTWKKQDVRLDNDINTIEQMKNGEKVSVNFALNPLLAPLDTGRLVAVWQQKKAINNEIHSQIASRVSDDFGQTWQPEQTVFTWEKNHIVEARMASKGNKIVVVAGYPGKGLLGFYGVDNKASKQLSWSELGGVTGTQNVNEISWLRPAISDDAFKVGFILQKEQTSKYQINVASMDLAKGQWEKEPFRMDRNKKQPVETKASYFDLKALPNGEFVIAWQDYRSIIPMLMLDYTSNKGTEWLSNSIELTRPGLSHIKFPELLVGNDKLRVNFEWDIIKDDKLPRLSTMQFAMDSKTGKLQVHGIPQGKQYSKDELTAKLKERVESFMDLRIKKEWEKSWPYMDPVYRQVTKKATWLKNMGYVTYEKSEIKKMDVDGRFATVDLDLTISLAQQIRGGELMEATPPKVTPTTTKWLWFHDDWYFFSEGSFFRYLKY